ncbi:glycosyltransferase family 2 protein [Candidatus Contubernalis alkaliaceticus]|uniref:glycosyltransferase family 2 protein n=1 Tax=Candidatus Contubernalis alkaliaceticus TaxID=338645 RepID=UPI001F4C3958|nr:glycosyltransferase family A protein [Candidatus Contubernalis alkalaceticus]UNC90684.1 glycosyltransferase family 2 protein [Candidatus Contubernalis alkalaceticus]
MISAVVPAQNEEKRIGIALHQLLNLKIDKIIVVLNGSSDNTLGEIHRLKSSRIEIINFKEKLGIDVPRAVGAKYAYKLGAKYVLFVDGDLVGNIAYELNLLLENCIKNRLDLSLTDCYPTTPKLCYLTKIIVFFRQLLNQETGLIDSLGISSPSHGPHIVSRRLLETIPIKELAVPPIEMVMALKSGLKIAKGVEIPHSRLGSSIKNLEHSQLIAQTIAGDCLEALTIYKNQPRNREYNGIKYMGYHSTRRWDLLAAFFSQVDNMKSAYNKKLPENVQRD